MFSSVRIYLFSFLIVQLYLFGQEIIKTSDGLVEGYRQGKISIFKGIPFAAPPVGAFRWKAPQPVKSWEGIKKCIAFSASPVQGKPSPIMFWSKEFLIPETPISEDCLYLNVWTSNASPKDKKPV
ncbi:MAG: carboxylesterase family protein [Saprospiraceae bacterium]